MEAASARVVTLYGRPGCHLCDVAREQLEAIRAGGIAFELVERNIDEDDELLARYLELIPVIELDGRIVSELVPDLPSLRTTLATLSA
jgi:glutaredoxin